MNVLETVTTFCPRGRVKIFVPLRDCFDAGAPGSLSVQGRRWKTTLVSPAGRKEEGKQPIAIFFGNVP